MNIGLVFVSTGGTKMARALRSFRIGEPDLPVHIAMATSSKVWEANNAAVPTSYFESQPNVLVRHISSPAYINGCYNEAMKWMRELGYTHVCSIHDDTVFSPLPENRFHMSSLFHCLHDTPEMQNAAGLSLSFMEALVQTDVPGCWHRSPDQWDKVDLESESVWRTLLPDGKPALYFGSVGSDEGVKIHPPPVILTEQNVQADLHLSDWFAKYFVTERTCPMARLGPSGQIVPVEVWEAIGGFDEGDGIFYDMEYPVTTALRGLPPVKVVPNTPYLHIHCQSTIGDPAVGIWSCDWQAFNEKYGKRPDEVLRGLPNGGGY